ncbi:MAG: hypothetical protein ABFD82_04135 [Syntrophaceae bacterium]
MFFRKVKRIGKILGISIFLLLVCAGAALAFNPPASADPFYAAWNFVANTVIGGAMGTCVALIGMAYGVYQFIKHPELGLLGTLGAGVGIACLGMLPTIVKGLGMVV